MLGDMAKEWQKCNFNLFHDRRLYKVERVIIGCATCINSN